MRRSFSVAQLVGGLIAISALLFLIDFLAFGSMRTDLAFYTLLDLAFIPVNVLIVGMFLNRLIAARERDELIHKMNMVVGAFFSQMGGELISRLATFDGGMEHDRQFMLFDTRWTAKDYEHNRREVGTERHDMHLEASDLPELRDFLASQRPFILGLLQNGNLLEHATFTDMLWAVSHLSEELSARGDLDDLGALCETDRRHLELDMSRAYGRLLGEWLTYVHHLQVHYPYLFAFAVRTNPFAGHDVQVRE